MDNQEKKGSALPKHFTGPEIAAMTFNNPEWLRSMLWLLLKQLGGQAEVDLTPAIPLAGQPPNADVGRLRFSYSEDMKSITLAI